MEVYSCIKKIRSAKSYLDKDIKQSDVAKILDAAHFAPSSGNIQNWRYIVVKSNKSKEKISRACLEQLWIQEAPVIIVICSDNVKIKAQYPKKWKKYSKQNCAASMQNMILQAQELGISSCWIRSLNEKKMQIILKIPDNVSVEGIITLGYSNEKYKEHFNKIEDLTFFETYGNRRRDTSIFPLAKHLKIIKKVKKNSK